MEEKGISEYKKRYDIYDDFENTKNAYWRYLKGRNEFYDDKLIFYASVKDKGLFSYLYDVVTKINPDLVEKMFALRNSCKKLHGSNMWKVQKKLMGGPGRGGGGALFNICLIINNKEECEYLLKITPFGNPEIGDDYLTEEYNLWLNEVYLGKELGDRGLAPVVYDWWWGTCSKSWTDIDDEGDRNGPIGYTVMEKMDHTYGDALKTATPEEAKTMWDDAEDLIDNLHNIRIIHFDIKPDNIMFKNGQMKVIDFGLSYDFNGIDDDTVVTMSQLGPCISGTFTQFKHHDYSRLFSSNMFHPDNYSAYYESEKNTSNRILKDIERSDCY